MPLEVAAVATAATKERAETEAAVAESEAAEAAAGPGAASQPRPLGGVAIPLLAEPARLLN